MGARGHKRIASFTSLRYATTVPGTIKLLSRKIPQATAQCLGPSGSNPDNTDAYYPIHRRALLQNAAKPQAGTARTTGEVLDNTGIRLVFDDRG
jgi:hypothetical protein